jgi:hypothetical protein
MTFLLTYVLFFFILPLFYLLFISYSDFIAGRDQILLLAKEIHVLQEKQNILISEIQKLNVQINVIENASSTYFTNSNLFYGFVGLSVLIVLVLFLYDWGSGDTADLIIDSAKRQAQVVCDCTKLLADGIGKLGDHVSNVNTLGHGALSEQLLGIQLQIVNLDSKIDCLAYRAGLSGDLSAEFIRTMQENPGVFFGYS